MASWLTAQLKAAEGLLEAVDKTVSRTVGTLGLAEGDLDYVPGSTEYTGARPAGAFQQVAPPSAPGPTFQHSTPPRSTYPPHPSGGLGPPATSATAPGYGSSAGPGRPVPWEPRPAAAPHATAAGEGGEDESTGPAAAVPGGFTVKADAPIPFGGAVTGTGMGMGSPPSGSSPIGRGPPARGSSGDGLGNGNGGSAATVLGSFSGRSAAPAAAGTTGSTLAPSYPSYATGVLLSSTAHYRATGADPLQLPGKSAGVVGSSTPAAAPNTAAAGVPLASGAAASTTDTPEVPSSGHVSTATPTPSVSLPAGDTGYSGGDTRPGTDVSAAAAATAKPSLTTTGLAVPTSATSASSQSEGPGQPHSAPGDAPMPSTAHPAPPRSGARSFGTGDAAAGPAGSAPTGEQHPTTSATPATSTAAGDAGGATAGFSGAGAMDAAPVPTAGTQAGAPPATPVAAGPVAAATPPPPPTRLASATAARASSLASAMTSSAVSHSLSFFNLVLEDPEAAGGQPQPQQAAAEGPGGSGASITSAAASQQVQSLTRTCDQLRKRLEASRVENEQLEDMLARAEVRAQQEAALVSALREELAGAQQARAATEGSLAAQLAVAKSSLVEVSDKYEASQRTVLVLEGQLAALEESSRRLMAQHSDREGGMVDALRSELTATESRLAAERKAHQASRAAAASREQDLEQQIAGNTAALADLTRSLEEANRKARALEEEVVEASRGRNDLAAQVAALRRKMEDAGLDPDASDPATAAAGGTGGTAGGDGAPRRGGAAAAAAAVAAELEVLRSELVQHQRAAQLARQAAEVSEVQLEAVTAELEALRQTVEQRKDTAQLEAQLREVSDMLYLKQTQMERLAAEKAAQQLKMERELESVRQELAKLTRQTIQHGGGGRGIAGAGGPDGSPSSSHGPSQSHDVIPMDALGEPYQRLARNNKVGRAVKAAANFLDSTASTTSFVLRQYPLARLAVFGYAVLVHLYVYLLIARMQRLATHYEAVVAPSEG